MFIQQMVKQRHAAMEKGRLEEIARPPNFFAPSNKIQQYLLVMIKILMQKRKEKVNAIFSLVLLNGIFLSHIRHLHSLIRLFLLICASYDLQANIKMQSFNVFKLRIMVVTLQNGFCLLRLAV